MTSFEAIILAKGAPNKTSDGSVTMCAIALSPEFGLVRLYPLRFESENPIKVWSKVEVAAIRSRTDNRHESWKIQTSKIIGHIDNPTIKADTLDQCVLKSGVEDPIAYQNRKRASIAIVKTQLPVGCGLKPRQERESQHDREDQWCMTQSEYPYKPYLFWTSDQGGEHETHIVAQEVYVGMSKNASCQMNVFANLRIGDPDYQHWMVLGNMKDRRNVWVCASLHRLKKTGLNTASNFWITAGEGDAWPYLNQEEVNAKDAGPQMLLPFTT